MSLGPETKPYRITKKGFLLRLRLTPNSSRDEIIGIIQLPDGAHALKVHVRAVPEKGKANKAVVKLIAKSIGIPPSKISLASGTKDRNKELLIEDTGDQLAMVRDWLGEFTRK